MNQRKVDLMFYVEPSHPDSNKHAAMLVEFKGKAFSDALEQINETLLYLNQNEAWKNAKSLKKYGLVVLSNGRQVPACQNRLLKIQKHYNVRIMQKSTQMTVVVSLGELKIQ